MAEITRKTSTVDFDKMAYKKAAIFIFAAFLFFDWFAQNFNIMLKFCILLVRQQLRYFLRLPQNAFNFYEAL